MPESKGALDTRPHKHLISVTNRAWCRLRFAFLLLRRAPPRSVFCLPSLSPYLFVLPFHLITPPHLSPLLCHITHPVCAPLPISPSLTPPNLFLLRASLHPVAPAALSPTLSSISLPFSLSGPFVFRRISSLSHHLFADCLVSRAAEVSVTCTLARAHARTHKSFPQILLPVFLSVTFMSLSLHYLSLSGEKECNESQCRAMS